MRLWLIMLAGLLCFALSSCPKPEDDYENQPAIDDEGMRQPDFAQEEEAATPGDEEADMPAAGDEAESTDEAMGDAEMAAGEFCELCGQKGCDGSCGGEGGYCTHCGMKGCDGSCMASDEEMEELKQFADKFAEFV